MNQRIDPGWAHWIPYSFSPAIARDGWLFVSGLVAHGDDGRIVHPGNLVSQAELVLVRLGQVLRAARCDYTDVVATREYITTLNHYQETAELRRRFFPEPAPAATGVVVTGLVIKEAMFELEAIARLP